MKTIIFLCKISILEETYKNAVIEAAINKLNKVNKPLSKGELIRGVVAILKRNLGKEDKRHTSKIIFKHFLE